MGRQIQVAQCAEDEQEFVDWMLGLGEFACLPLVFETGGARVDRIGNCSARQQIIFPTSLSESMLQGVRPLLGDDDSSQVAPIARDGRCIEWLRTHSHGSTVFVVGGALESRYFIQSNTGPGCEKEIAKVFNKLVRFVRSTYPLVSADGSKRYIGPRLSQMLTAKGASLCYPSGAEVEFSENPNFKPKKP